MSDLAVAAILLLPAYFLGTFPSALLVARVGGHDVLTEGSGNPGASNVAPADGLEGRPGRPRRRLRQGRDRQRGRPRGRRPRRRVRAGRGRGGRPHVPGDPEVQGWERGGHGRRDAHRPLPRDRADPRGGLVRRRPGAQARVGRARCVCAVLFPILVGGRRLRRRGGGRRSRVLAVVVDRPTCREPAPALPGPGAADRRGRRADPTRRRTSWFNPLRCPVENSEYPSSLVPRSRGRDPTRRSSNR